MRFAFSVIVRTFLWLWKISVKVVSVSTRLPCSGKQKRREREAGRQTDRDRHTERQTDRQRVEGGGGGC